MQMKARDFRSLARQNLSGRWLISALVCFIASLLGSGSSTGSSLNFDFESQDLSTVLSPDVVAIIEEIALYLLIYAGVMTIIAFIIGGVIYLGVIRYFLNQHDQKPHEVKDIFSQFFNFGNAFCLRLLTAIYTFLWTLLLIIPGIVKAYSYALAPYLMAEHPEWSANECITKSKLIMDGYKFRLFCLDLSFIGWELLCIFTLGIGNLFLAPYMQASRTAFYRDLCPAAEPQPDPYFPPTIE